MTADHFVVPRLVLAVLLTLKNPRVPFPTLLASRILAVGLAGSVAVGSPIDLRAISVKLVVSRLFISSSIRFAVSLLMPTYSQLLSRWYLRGHDA